MLLTAKMKGSRVKIRLLLWTLPGNYGRMALFKAENDRMGIKNHEQIRSPVSWDSGHCPGLRGNVVKENSFWDYLIAGVIVIIGMAEAVHLAGVFGGLSLRLCSILLCCFIIGGFLAGMGVLFCRRKALAESLKKKREEGLWADKTGRVFHAIFALMLVSQLIFLWFGEGSYRERDMTVETVGSFLAEDGIYRVNPMTGMPYEGGMPLRLKILCLPTLYAGVCRLTGLHPSLVVRVIMPTLTLLGCYGAFASLARCLFPDREGSAFRNGRACFVTLVSLLMWAGAYRYGMDGFNLLCCGWQGVSIRNGVILPWMFSLCLRKKWKSVILCILAEACMVWTLYGCGICLLAAAGMAAAQLCGKMWIGKGKEREFK